MSKLCQLDQESRIHVCHVVCGSVQSKKRIQIPQFPQWLISSEIASTHKGSVTDHYNFKISPPLAYPAQPHCYPAWWWISVESVQGFSQMKTKKSTLTFNMMEHLCNSCVTCVLLSKPLNNRKHTNRDLSDLTAIHLWCDCISIHRVRFNLTRSHDPCPMYQVCMCVAYNERKEHARSSLKDFKLT